MFCDGFLTRNFFTPGGGLAHRDNPQPGGLDPPSQLRPEGWLLQYPIGVLG